MCQDAFSDKLQFNARTESSLDTAWESDSEVDRKGGIERGVGVWFNWNKPESVKFFPVHFGMGTEAETREEWLRDAIILWIFIDACHISMANMLELH